MNNPKWKEKTSLKEKRGVLVFKERFLEKAKISVFLMLVFFFNQIPIKKNKIFLFSYYGNQYGCNPKYISEFILSHYPRGTFDIVWAFNDIDQKPSVPGIRMVKNMSLKYFYEICTSKIVITNFRTTEIFRKRKKQYYIQTWHSSLRLKQIEKDAEETLPKSYIKMAIKDSKKINLLVSGSKFSTDIFRRSFWYDGEIIEQGTPRNDLLFHLKAEKRKSILENLGIPESQKVVLYAPTFRNGNRLDVYNLEYSRVLENLKGKFGGDWIFLIKLHPHLLGVSCQFQGIDHVKDVTSYEDIQELLAVTDILISDYSSLMFDFSITGRPCFLYVPDIKEYIQQDRKLYFNLKDLPFISADSNIALLKKINFFNVDDYHKSLNEFLIRVGTYEKGNACEALGNRIEEICFNKNRREIYEAI